MLKNYKTFLLILIPIIFALAVGVYFGYEQYFAELQDGNDSSDSMQWAIIGGFFYSPLGLLVGLIIDVFVAMIISVNTVELEKVKN